MTFLVGLLLIMGVSSIKMILFLGENEGPKCFYQYLSNYPSMKKVEKSMLIMPRG